MSGPAISLQTLIERFWVAPDNAEWTPKTTAVSLAELKEWMSSEDIEVLGFIDGLIDDQRFRIEPPLPVADYIVWVKHYYGRCLRENPDGEWSESSYSAGWNLVGIFISLWDDTDVPGKHLLNLKNWLAETYRGADECLKTCIVHATLEHLFERKLIRKYFSDWKDDPVLAIPYREACLWDIKTPLSRKLKNIHG